MTTGEPDRATSPPLAADTLRTETSPNGRTGRVRLGAACRGLRDQPRASAGRERTLQTATGEAT